MDKLDSDNFFDRLTPTSPEDWIKGQKEQESKGKRIDYLIHQTFQQNEAGAELLAMWKESLIMAATAEGGLDSVEIGIREGQKRFIRGILLTIKRVENE